MSSSPFFMKVSFYVPSAENKGKNVAHVNYIGKRSGVELNNEKQPTRDFDDMNETELTKQLDFESSDEVDPGSSEGHLKYIDERPGSHGLFGQQGTEDISLVRKEIKTHEGVVWRGILSLKEEDAQRLGYMNQESWANTLRAAMPDAANQIGIKESNLRWSAAFHQEEGHPHVHFMMWEKDPQRIKGMLSKGEREDLRKSFVKEIYAEERLLLAQEKTAMRDLMRELAVDTVSEQAKIIREIRQIREVEQLRKEASGELLAFSLPKKLYKDDQETLIKEMRDLTRMLPGQGRIAYQYMPDDVKEKVDEISDWLIKRPQFTDSLKRYTHAVEQMTKHYRRDDVGIERAKEKALEDLRKRISQVVLKGVVESEKNSWFTVDQVKAGKAVIWFEDAQGKPSNDLPEKVIQRSMDLLQDYRFSQEQQKDIIRNWIKQGDLQLSEEKINTIIGERSFIQNESLDGTEKTVEQIEQDEKKLALILSLAHKKEEAISELLNSIPLENRQRVLEKVKEHYLKENMIEDNVWKKLNQITDNNIKYPVKEVTISDIDPEKKNQLLDLFQKAGNANKEDEGWSAFCMNAALKQSGVDTETRESLIENWTKENTTLNNKSIQKILKITDEQNGYFLRKSTWEKLLKNIDSSMEYPWITRTEVVIEKDKINEMKQAIQNTNFTDQSIENKLLVTKEYIRSLKEEHTAEELQDIVSKWNEEKVGLDKELSKSTAEADIKRQDDVETMMKAFKLVDPIEKAVINYSKVLLSAGESPERVEQIINEWNDRTEANIPEDKINKYIDRARKEYSESQEWGREIVLSKKDYENLKEVLGIEEAPYFWKGQNPYAHDEYAPGFAKGLWKEVCRGVQQSMNQAEAQTKQAQHEHERIQEQQRIRKEEKSRERG